MNFADESDMVALCFPNSTMNVRSCEPALYFQLFADAASFVNQILKAVFCVHVCFEIHLFWNGLCI